MNATIKNKDFVKEMAKVTHYKQDEVKLFMNAFIETMKYHLVDGDKVVIDHFGIFSTKERGERCGINPNSGEKITLKAKRVPNMKFSATIKNAVADIAEE